MSDRKFPEIGELIIGTITKVFPYGAFIRLDEYKGLTGMVHVSEISSKWIKNIREYVKEDQVVVAKVLRIKVDKEQIDLSIKGVKAFQRKERLDEYKQNTRATRLLEMAAQKIDDKEGLKKVIPILEENFDSLYKALEESVINENGADTYKDLGLSEKWTETIAECAKDNIEIPKKTIAANFELETLAPNGAEVIRESFEKAMKTHEKTKDVEIKIKYIGAPKYRIELSGMDYKLMEKVLNGFAEDIMSAVKQAQGKAELIRQ